MKTLPMPLTLKRSSNMHSSKEHSSKEHSSNTHRSNQLQSAFASQCRHLRALWPTITVASVIAMAAMLTPSLARSADGHPKEVGDDVHAVDAPAIDTRWVLQMLARPAPMRTDFVEVRASALLKTPLRLSGEYQRPRDDTFIREVRSPYREITTIRADEATIARDGKPPRTFSLSRIPELASLQTSFGAMLAGDRAGIDRAYRIRAEGTHSRWILVLVPKDAAFAARVRDIRLYGQGAELRCIETQPVRGDVQRTLLASAARAAAATSDDTALRALCREGVKH